jgi:hypothetical protein
MIGSTGRSLLASSLFAACVAASQVSAGVGDKAPPLEPSQWLNHIGPISWDSLKGRLILVEKWATW